MLVQWIAVACLIWYIAVVVVCTVGYIQLTRYYSSPPNPAAVLSKHAESPDLPHITIIRPVKGLEPRLYECLAATFRQTYPRHKLSIFFCIASEQDPGFPVLEQVLEDFSGFDARLLIEEEDPLLQDAQHARLGPNPKIRNMSRAYREAKGDLIWIIDCNVWIGAGVAGRMVDTLCGFGGKRKNKFVHQLPLVIDTIGQSASSIGSHGLQDPPDDAQIASSSTQGTQIHIGSNDGNISSMSKLGGGRLEELFMSSAHAKFYTAINTVLIAPCIVGKSNMFRRSHLNALTEGQGIDYFSHNICEDHLIGDLLWKRPVPDSMRAAGEKPWGNHAMVFGDLAIQPMAGMSVREYVARRVRWLRVRKYTVTLATFVEPGTESFLCSLYGAYAVTTLPWFQKTLGISPTWTSFALLWLFSVLMWSAVDWTLYRRLHSAASIEVDENTPAFARRPASGNRRPFKEWLAAWVGRETLALPVWTWAVWGGATVVWRGKKLWVGMDMEVHEIEEEGKGDKRRKD
ncbi:glycosyltransferase family 21 protein [Aulographum hederae CBS 113979]|uniref:Ceramide glucosyltransferase n=1 Tax=Aulographum hederae CBS 113979 TaxID=1176131 RepID=A0A6G1HDK8_9PEZI|nr:glycosyltransferase family 21 protein [Aulographum hederae CBS 113979]